MITILLAQILCKVIEEVEPFLFSWVPWPPFQFQRSSSPNHYKPFALLTTYYFCLAIEESPYLTLPADSLDMGRLQVRLLRAQSLALASEWGTLYFNKCCTKLTCSLWQGYTEPYCTFQVGITKHTISTQPVNTKKPKSKDPQFNKSFTFDVSNPFTDKLHVHFYDKDESGTEHPIGETTISLTHLKKNQEVVRSFFL